jgi:GntR family transcriptional regulator
MEEHLGTEVFGDLDRTGDVFPGGRARRVGDSPAGVALRECPRHGNFGLAHRTHGANLTGTMSGYKIDPSRPEPLYEQVAGEIRRAIAEGEAAPGERLPLAKDLATVLGVNKNTVLRAIRVLRDEGLLEFRRGRGITVAGTPERGALQRKVNELVKFASQQGYGREELVRLIESAP